MASARRRASSSGPEDYEKILTAFDDFGKPPPTPSSNSSRRNSTGTNEPSDFGNNSKNLSNSSHGSNKQQQHNNSSKNTRRNSVNSHSSGPRSSSRGRMTATSPTGDTAQQQQHSSSAHRSSHRSSRRQQQQQDIVDNSEEQQQLSIGILDTSEMTLDISQSSRHSGSHNNNGVDLKVRNRALLHENRRLQELVDEYEKKLAAADPFASNTSLSQHTGHASRNSQIDHNDDEHGGAGDDEMSKLKSKIKALKSKRKSEKMSLLQAKKSVDTHSLEIEGLQRELNKILTQLELSQKERLEDKQLIHSLQKHLEMSRRQQGGGTNNSSNSNTNNSQIDAAAMERLKADLTKRDSELEMTLELLQSKVERIMHLEYEVEKGKEKLLKTERLLDELVAQNGGAASNFSSSRDLLHAEAEVKSLRRQNMMLKLVVEELQEARKRRSDSDIDIDSVFLKLPPEIQEEIPRSVGLGVLTFDGTADDASVITENLASFLGGGSNNMPRQDPDHPLKRGD